MLHYTQRRFKTKRAERRESNLKHERGMGSETHPKQAITGIVIWLRKRRARILRRMRYRAVVFPLRDHASAPEAAEVSRREMVDSRP